VNETGVSCSKQTGSDKPMINLTWKSRNESRFAKLRHKWEGNIEIELKKLHVRPLTKFPCLSIGPIGGLLHTR
jgi:hypothetical protein